MKIKMVYDEAGKVVAFDIRKFIDEKLANIGVFHNHLLQTGGKQMNIVFAKHSNQNKEFLFEVPEGMDIKKGDILYVETMKGPCVAVATSDTMPGNEELVIRLGAYMPLKKVITYANEEIRNYICDCVTCEMVTQIMQNRKARNRNEQNMPF